MSDQKAALPVGGERGRSRVDPDFLVSVSPARELVKRDRHFVGGAALGAERGAPLGTAISSSASEAAMRTHDALMSGNESDAGARALRWAFGEHLPWAMETV